MEHKLEPSRDVGQESWWETNTHLLWILRKWSIILPSLWWPSHNWRHSSNFNTTYQKVNFTVYKLTKPFKNIYKPLSHLLPNSGQKLQKEISSVWKQLGRNGLKETFFVCTQACPNSEWLDIGVWICNNGNFAEVELYSWWPCMVLKWTYSFVYLERPNIPLRRPCTHHRAVRGEHLSLQGCWYI